MIPGTRSIGNRYLLYLHSMYRPKYQNRGQKHNLILSRLFVTYGVVRVELLLLYTCTCLFYAIFVNSKLLYVLVYFKPPFVPIEATHRPSRDVIIINWLRKYEEFNGVQSENLPLAEVMPPPRLSSFVYYEFLIDNII